MGCHSSKLNGAIPGDKVAVPIAVEFVSSFEEACTLIPDLKYLISSTKLNKFLLKNQTLISIAKDYLTTTLLAMKLLASLKTSVSKARLRHAIILQVLQCFEVESDPNSVSPSYSQTLAKMREYKNSEDPFAGSMTQEFASLCKQHELMLKKLTSKKDEIRDKLKLSKKWKNVWKITCTAAFISILIFSVILAAMSAPPVATGAAVVGSTMIKTGEQWFDTWWAQRFEGMEGEREVVGEMWRGGVVRVHEMESIRAMIEGLEMGLFGSVLYYAQFATEWAEGRDTVVAMAVGKVKGKVVEVEEGLGGVEMKVDACVVEIKKAVVEFFKVTTDIL